jgi:hypothetical protein
MFPSQILSLRRHLDLVHGPGCLQLSTQQARGQLFISVHNETLFVVAMCVCNPDRPLESIAETQSAKSFSDKIGTVLVSIAAYHEAENKH